MDAIAPIHTTTLNKHHLCGPRIVIRRLFTVHFQSTRKLQGGKREKKITKRGPALLLYSPSSNWLLAV